MSVFVKMFSRLVRSSPDIVIQCDTDAALE